MCALALTRNFNGEYLVLEYIKNKNQVNKEQAIQSFLPLVKNIVGRIHLPNTATLTRDDLLQFGIIGLLDALERFSPNRGATFKTYAFRRIQGEIVDAIRREGVLNRDQTQILNKISKASKELRGVLGREPTSSEICEKAGITAEMYSQTLHSNSLNYRLSLDDKIAVSEDDVLTRKDTIADDNQVPPDVIMEKEELKAELKKIIKRLPERKRIILALYYYEDLTLFDIGQMLGISESRVSQVLNQTLGEMREQLVF
ncbi:MAG: FliA/WhiG family RNA polymerase sigma factor [Candidatus Hatepunaea meridiana]|nr:FliA/WhiG family RNA polymerase sigma factor [Candidatus Hatepunaea meridiana]